MKDKSQNLKIDLKKEKIKSSKYRLFPVDLNEVDEIFELLDHQEMDYTKPTLIITECVLVYLNEGVTDKLY